MKCINHSHPEYLELKKIESNLLLLDSIIDKFQRENHTEEFPDKQYVANVLGKAIKKSSDIKEGVAELFESNPELANIGTPEQYSQYLDTIFPDSKIKDIVYHATDAVFERFKPIKPKFDTLNSIEGVYNFTTNKEFSKRYGKNILSVILNINNPIQEKTSGEFIDDMDRPLSEGLYKIGKKKSDNVLAPKYDEALKNTDAIINRIEGDNYALPVQTVISVFEPEQIHILGNKKDIEGFSEFVQNKLSDDKSSKPKLKPKTKPLSEMLARIMSATTDKALLRLTKTLLNVVSKNDVDVVFMTHEQMSEIEPGIHKSTTGMFKNNTIYINTDQPFRSEEEFHRLILHEALHVFTVSVFQRDISTLTPKELQFRRRMEKMHKNYQGFAIAQFGNEARQGMIDGDDRYYGFKDPKEFISEIFTSPDFKGSINILDKVFNMETVREIITWIIDLLGLSTNNNVEVIQEYVLNFITNDYRHVNTPSDSKTSFKLKARTEVVNDILKTNETNDYKAEDDAYVDKSGSRFKRLTNFVFDTFNNKFKGIDTSLSSEERTNKIAEAQARKFFKSKNLNPDKDSVTIEENNESTDYTFDEYTQRIKMDLETGRVYGVISHAIVELEVAALKGDTVKVKELQDKIVELASFKPGLQNEIDLKELQWISEEIEDIFDKLGLNFSNPSVSNRDNYHSELPFVNEELGIGTTIDGLVEHANGQYSLFDFKAGAKFTSDQQESVLLKFAKNLYNDQFDTRESKAKLELMFRAFLLKQKYPDMKFRDIAVVHFRNKKIKIYDTDSKAYLQIIENYYKETQPELYKKLKAKDLFNTASYAGTSHSLALQMTMNKGVSKKDLADKLSKRLETLIVSKPEQYRTKEDVEEIEQLTKDIMDLRFGGSQLNNEDDLDVGWFKRHFGTTAEVFNPLIQRFNILLNRARHLISKDEESFRKDHKVYYSELEKEYYSRFPARKLLNKGVIGGLLWTSKDFDGSGIFDFMWKKKVKGEVEGYYMLSLAEIETANLTKAQKAYAKFIRNTIETNYNETMLRTITLTERRGDKMFQVKKTIAEILDYPDQLPEDFTPRMVMGLEEFAERKMGVNKETAKFMLNKAASNLFDQIEVNEKSKNIGVPVKYMGQSPYLINNELHSFNPNFIAEQFMSSMTKKRHMDDLYILGKGMIAYFENKGEKEYENKKQFQNTIDFVLDHIDLQVLDVKKDTKFSRKEIKVPGTNTKVSPDKVLGSLKGWVTSAAMHLQVVNGVANGVLVTMLNNKEGAKNDLALKLGADESDIDFGLKELTWANEEIAELAKDQFLGKEDTNKLWLLAKEMKFLPDNYDYKANKSTLHSAKNKLMNEALLYFAHSLGENYGQFILLAAQLKRSGLYDKYSVKEVKNESGEVVYGELEWTGGVRFKTTDGREVTGITPEEIMRMKRVSQRIHGGYRKEERTAMELHALGQWLLQFKKYLPSILINMTQRRGDDMSLGKWVKFPEKVDGEDVYEWVARVNEGRIVTVLNMIGNFTGIYTNSQYDFKNLTTEQRKNVVDMVLSFSLFFGLMALRGLMFDDDDEETMLYKRFARLNEDVIQGYHPVDMLRNFQTQQNIVPKMMETTKAVTAFLTEGLIEGKTTNDGYLVGQKGVMKALPIFNSAYQLDRWIENDEDKYWNIR